MINDNGCEVKILKTLLIAVLNMIKTVLRQAQHDSTGKLSVTAPEIRPNHNA